MTHWLSSHHVQGIIMVEQLYGEHKSPQPVQVVAVYALYALMPLLVATRAWRSEPFFAPAPAPSKAHSS